jgi:hypothetical protein
MQYQLRTREEILEERRQLKAEYGQLVDSMSALLFRHDPIGIAFDNENTDEYDPETGTILPRLRNCECASDVLRSGLNTSLRALTTVGAFLIPFATVSLGRSQYAKRPLRWRSRENPPNLATDLGRDCDGRAFGGTGL